MSETIVYNSNEIKEEIPEITRLFRRKIDTENTKEIYNLLFDYAIDRDLQFIQILMTSSGTFYVFKRYTK